MKMIVNLVKRVLHRFILLYWICFIFPFPLDIVGLPFQVLPERHQPDWFKSAGKLYREAYQWQQNKKTDCCKWVGKEVLGVEVIIQPTGSGDTMRSYVGCLCAAVIAIGLVIVWSFLVWITQKWQPGWNADWVLDGVVRVLVRYFLIAMLLGYGFAKVFPNQFPEPTYRLAQPFGDLTPMGLLWAFMGFSPVYQMITGAVEVLSGLLLVTRRTTMLGSMMTVMAMTQVFILNMCFDVPVKLYSLHYLVMGLFLLAPFLPKFFKVFVLQQATEAAPIRPLVGSKWIDRGASVFKLLLIAGYLTTNIQGNFDRWNRVHGGPPAPVQGRWETVFLQIDGKDPAVDDPLNWKSLDFSFKSVIRIFGTKLPAMGYLIEWNPDVKQLTLTRRKGPTWTAQFDYDLPQPDTLVLNGKVEGQQIVGRFKKLPEKNFELTTRGFHWIQERPYN